MKIKVINKAWYNNRLYDPEIEGEEVIEYAGDKCPSWGVVVGGEKPAKPAQNKNDGENNKGDNAPKAKVKDLPVVEKNALLEAAKAVGIEGNQILSWNVETLKAKIEAKKPKDEDENDGENNDEDNKGEGEE